jgi:hypothetical protein
MNRLISTCLFTSSLFLFQGCSLLSKNVEASDQEQQTMEHHDMDNMDAESGSHHDMDNMDMGEETVKTQTEAKLTVPDAIAPNQSVPLAINIQDSAGKPVGNFDIFQEKLMHLIVVSDDLEFFSHIHPKYNDQAQFDLETSLPKPGKYTLFSDYKPTGDAERVSLMQLSVTGNQATPAKIDESLTKSFGKTKVNFSTDQEQIKANEPVTLKFDLKDTASNALIKDLQPYLGKTGHLVIVKQSNPLTSENYIHAHASEGTSLGKVDFQTQFPEPGKYKLWGQFNRNGEIVTADFWVDVI